MTKELRAMVEVIPAATFLSDDELLKELERLTALADEYAKAVGKIEQEALKRMGDRTATTIPHEDYECKLEIKNEFDYPAFRALKEVFNPSDFAECLIPEHTIETVVQEKWVTSTVKRLCREYGAETQAIYDRATIPGKRRLVFKRRDKK